MVGVWACEYTSQASNKMRYIWSLFLGGYYTLITWDIVKNVISRTEIGYWKYDESKEYIIQKCQDTVLQGKINWVDESNIEVSVLFGKINLMVYTKIL